MAGNEQIDGASLKAGDRVKRVDTEGPLGVVQKVRIETVRQSIRPDGDPPGITVTVLWDNGTLSHFVPGGLEKIGS
ncbi:MAG: hypothetical protein KDD69_10355 [Bdellovibrionales bacterium]|nr:hypothetical protein [Bdellovibrionales bacterium]